MQDSFDPFFGVSDVPPAYAKPDEDYVRVHGVIAKDLNEKIKLIARKRGIHASQLIGEMIIKSSAELDNWLIREKAFELQNELGADWLSRLQTASMS